MPIYDYECPKCQAGKEVNHGISAKPKVKCPACGAAMKRIISRNSFQLKGDGWFKTTGSYAKSAAPAAAKKGGE